jgi:folate-binding protein YgfZ
MPDIQCRLAPLEALATVAVDGKDAAAFLAAQLSQQIPAATGHTAPFAAWHDAKGRVQGLFRVIRRGDGFLLLTHSSVVADLVAGLHRYVLRADVRITAGLERIAGLLGDCAASFDAAGARLGREHGDMVAADNEIRLRLGSALTLLIAPAQEMQRWVERLPAAPAADAERAEIHLGLPLVSASLRGLFLPQMLNLDLLGGVAFDKGCYPGQEVIARTQNLGTVKRRLLRFSTTASADAAPAAGTKLLDSAGQTVGTIVRAAHGKNGIDLLAVTELAARNTRLSCAELPGARLQLEALPYPVPGLGPPRGVHG